MPQLFLANRGSATGLIDESTALPSSADVIILDSRLSERQLRDSVIPHHSRDNNGATPGYARATTGSISTAETLYWTDIGGTPIASTSQGALRRIAHSKLDDSRVRLALCTNLPGFLRHLSFWEGINTVKPGSTLTYHNGRPQVLDQAVATDHPNLDLPEAAELLLAELTRSIERRILSYGTLSADVSGGMDSTSLAYVLDSLQKDSIYYHAGTDDPHNRDSQYARRAASELHGDFTELESLTATAGAFSEFDQNIQGLDDGPLAWAGNSKHLRLLLIDASQRGVKAHLTGVGGDELFDPLPATALDLLTTSSWKAGLRIIRRLGKMQRWSTLAVARAVGSNVNFETEMLRRVEAPAGNIVGPAEAFSWAPGFGISKFATAETREVVAEKAKDALRQGAGPHHKDRFRHQMTEAVMFQGEIVRQVNHAYEHLGVAWEAPYLDDAVFRLVLSLPTDILIGTRDNKPLLARATEPVAPRWLFTREDKGEYSSDLFTEYKKRRHDLSRLFDESYLVDMGHINADAVRDALSMPVVSTDELFEIEQLAGVERWVRTIQ
ncbi:asparagine synthase (glutamine-hydrolyzing) [Paenarthrobacter nicotinovorans]|uniref:asparagine synthase-related protein n=1 Tax=Micrococcaceae TaxID=1268 RepID=UPI00047A6E00|nr:MULTISPECIES: asparagine synthase-related protein [Micrococcaceae]MDR6438222.1 asparagine synthase (glutamine-hydrolyzing) [Paenarthrobacter nicotinovorans]SCZ52613.1 Asparagine synthase [Arthrobacter sp. UNCCL28]